MITKAMDERRTKDRILGSLTWKGDSMKGARNGNQEIKASQ